MQVMIPPARTYTNEEIYDGLLSDDQRIMEYLFHHLIPGNAARLQRQFSSHRVQNDALDVTLQALEKIRERILSGQYTRGSFRAWLFRVSFSLLKDLKQSARVQRSKLFSYATPSEESAELDPTSPAPLPGEQMDQEDLVAQIAAFMETRSDLERAVFGAYYRGGLKPRHVAAELGIPADQVSAIVRTVKNAIYKAFPNHKEYL